MGALQLPETPSGHRPPAFFIPQDTGKCWPFIGEVQTRAAWGDFVVDSGSADVEDSAVRDFPVLHATRSHALPQHHLSKINRLKFYHSIR